MFIFFLLNCAVTTAAGKVDMWWLSVCLVQFQVLRKTYQVKSSQPSTSPRTEYKSWPLFSQKLFLQAISKQKWQLDGLVFEIPGFSLRDLYFLSGIMIPFLASLLLQRLYELLNYTAISLPKDTEKELLITRENSRQYQKKLIGHISVCMCTDCDLIEKNLSVFFISSD